MEVKSTKGDQQSTHKVSTLVKSQSANPVDNDYCFDCNTTPVSHASLPNGVFLCETCAGYHERLQSYDSTATQVKSLECEWSE